MIKLCECGCGNPTPLAIKTNTKKGQIKGDPQRFILGHNSKLKERRELLQQLRKKEGAIPPSRKGVRLSKETKRKMSKARNKGLTPITKLIRKSTKYLQWRQNCFIRDNFTCQKCGITGEYLESHHKKSFSKLLQEAKKYLPLFDLYEAAMLYIPLWDISNGITLCTRCHILKRKIHS